jgi:tRNA(Ile)-lysidine synthase
VKLEKVNDAYSYLLAVSSGIDSMVMAHLFLKKKIKFSIAHCNFQLRAKEADEEAIFVKDWCEKNNIPCFIKHFDTKLFAIENKLSIQEAARNLRYDFFYALKKEHSFDWIATAHHQDDNIETTLFNFLRGTGIKGLLGIPAVNGSVIRPIIKVSRNQIEDYAKQHLIAFKTDSSNFKTDYTRNAIRRNIIPSLQEIFPEVKNNVANNIERFNEIAQIFNQAIASKKKKLIAQRGQDFYISIRKLKQLQPLQTILYECLKTFHFSFAQTKEVVKLLDSETGTLVENKTYRIIKHHHFLIVTEVKSIHTDLILICEDEMELMTKSFSLTFEKMTKKPAQYSGDKNDTYIDLKNIEFPLVLRVWRQGDYVYPLGMNKQKKVARILIDAKLSVIEKENVWVLESNKKIVWIVGMKLDNRFKLQENSTSIFHIKFKKIISQ